MHVLSDMVRNLVVIILLTTFLDLLLPAGSLQNFVKVVLGLFVLITLLNPVLKLLGYEQSWAVLEWPEQSRRESGVITEKTQALEAVNQKLVLDTYAKGLEGQIGGLVHLIQGAESSAVKVELDSKANVASLQGIKKVLIDVHKSNEQSGTPSLVKPVKVGITGKDTQAVTPTGTEKKKITTEIKALLQQYFGLRSEQVQIDFS